MMKVYILKRLATVIPMSLLVVSVTWGLIRIAPGNFYLSEKKLPAAIEQNIKKKYGLESSLVEQYLMMLGNMTCRVSDSGDSEGAGLKIAIGSRTLRCFDFGYSLKYEGQSVNEILSRHLPYSAVIGLLAFLIALVGGVSLGAVAATRKDSRVDRYLMSLSMIGISVPTFVLAPVLVLAFSFGLYWLPPARWGGMAHLVLPVLSLSAVYLAYIARLTRTGLIEVLKSDYIRTARAKGLSEARVVVGHALKAGILPVVSFSGPAIAGLLAGSVVIERIFAIPGLGNIFVQSVLNRDEPLTLGIVAFVSIVILVCNLVVDIVYALIDPRIRFGER